MAWMSILLVAAGLLGGTAEPEAWPSALATDDECSAASRAGNSPDCALNAIQLRGHVAQQTSASALGHVQSAVRSRLVHVLALYRQAEQSHDPAGCEALASNVMSCLPRSMLFCGDDCDDVKWMADDLQNFCSADCQANITALAECAPGLDHYGQHGGLMAQMCHPCLKAIVALADSGPECMDNDSGQFKKAAACSGTCKPFLCGLLSECGNVDAALLSAMVNATASVVADVGRDFKQWTSECPCSDE
mmetsp:Transcript_36616/g.94523  ORF Transcript_36616/g.94523 Transcript_36616/m.94523 type:complete len:248 (-) Transcript_36616:174-917(-)